MRNPKWSEDEVILLVDLYFDIKDMDIDITDAKDEIRLLSKTLRKLAVLNDDDNKKRNIESDVIELRIEIDKNSLSNGEKQIFIMALYHSLIQLCKHEVPFVIDTPFARIDTEHRINISTHFFSKIKGQVFILSTNEEIDSEHMQILDRKISSTYILENSDNKQTNIVQNSYFEV